MKGPALVVMARAPLPGTVKTRLQPQFTAVQSASIYAAFLHDALDLATSIEGVAPFVAFTPSREAPYFRSFVSGRAGLLGQGQGDLGRRMYLVMERLGQQGYSPVLVMGSDLPLLQPAHIRDALAALVRADVCLGPTPDGGYYLVGSARAHLSLFQGIPWSTPGVLRATLDQAEQHGLSVALVSECADVDTVDDLRRLAVQIRRLRNTPGARVPGHTEACLSPLPTLQGSSPGPAP